MENVPEGPRPINKPDNFQRMLGLSVEMIMKKPRVEGLSHLGEIPPNTPVIFAISHLSDIDVSAAVSALLPFRKIDVASLETNQADPKQAIFIRIMGGEHFHDVKNTFNTQTQMPHTQFDSDNFEQMRKVMEEGRDIAIAAHRPVRDSRLPDNAGVGDVYLSQITGAMIIPVALDVHSEKPVGMSADLGGIFRNLVTGNRPESTLRIGSPMQLEKIPEEDLRDAAKILMGQRDELRKDPVRYERALYTYRKLSMQGEMVLNAISDLLPPEKRRKNRQSGETT